MSTPRGIDVAEAGNAADREDKGQVVHIRDANTGELAYYEAEPGADPVPVTITVAGTFSNLYRRAMESRQERMLKGRRMTLTTAQLKKNRVELVTACVLDWSGFTKAGVPFPCTPDNVRALLTTAAWLLEQIEEAMDDHAAFFASPSTP